MATGVVVTVYVPVVPLAGMAIDTGTVAAGLLLNRYTVVPEGAGPLRVTLPAALLPPTIALAIVTAEMVGARTDTFVDTDSPFAVAVTTAGVFTPTDLVVKVKLTDVLPTGTVTVAGTATAALLLESATAVATAAGPVRVTVPVPL
jgi:hypothetical protein